MFRLIVSAFLLLPLSAQDISKLPDWARPHALAVASETVPDADAWVVLDRTEVAYGGENEVWTHRYRLVKVLGERGLSEGFFAMHGLGGKATRVKKLKGWNLRPDGELVKVDEDNVVSAEDVGEEAFSRQTLTAVSLPRVAKGSWIAYESLEVSKLPFGPIQSFSVLESHPMRTFEVEAGKREGWLSNLTAVDIKMDLVHFGGMIPVPMGFTGKSLRLNHLAALPKDEGGHPPFVNMLPLVVVRFMDPKLATAPVWESWDRPAMWFSSRYAEKARAGSFKGSADLASLTQLWKTMGQELTYKAVYLSPERGWIPEEASEVGRKKYGDCKDLTCYLMAEATALGFKVQPALTRIVDGRVEASETPSNAFNHVITAIRLEKTLGLAAEVDTPKGRYLLVDPTDPLTPLGKLNAGHRGGRVMVCLPEGALWMDVPESAVLEESLDFTLEGEASKEGVLRGSLAFKETGNAWGLRSRARHAGKDGLREWLLKAKLDLPPTGTLEVESFSDPMALEQPFTLKVKILHPEGFRASGSEYTVASLGWNILHPIIQKTGVPRVYPVERLDHSRLSYHARLKVPFHVEPILPEKTVQTAFRSARWKALVTPQGDSALLDLNLDHQAIPKLFGYAEREQGVQEWKKDRSVAKNLLSDALAFKRVP